MHLPASLINEVILIAMEVLRIKKWGFALIYLAKDHLPKNFRCRIQKAPSPLDRIMANFDELDAEEESRAGDVDLLDAENPPAAPEVRISSEVPRQRGSTHCRMSKRALVSRQIVAQRSPTFATPDHPEDPTQMALLQGIQALITFFNGLELKTDRLEAQLGPI